MFWTSVFDGMAAFGFWQTWAAFGAYLVIWFAFVIGCGLLTNKESGGRILAGGCLFMLGGLVLQAVLTGVMVLWLLPLLFGRGHTAEVSLIASTGWYLAKTSLLAMLLVLILSVIPIIGGFIVNFPGIQQYLLAVVIFSRFLRPALKEVGISADGKFPGFWAAVGYGVISVVLVYAFATACAAAGMRHERESWEKPSKFDEWAPLLMFGVGLCGGFAPFFMYTQYVRRALGL